MSEKPKSRATKVLDSISEMALSRSKWIDRLRDKWIGGALGEYSKLKIARDLGLSTSTWPREVASHLKKVKQYFDPEETKTKSNFDREDAFKEVLQDSMVALYKFRPARADMMRKYPKHAEEIEKIIYDEQDLVREMIMEFLPELAHLLPSKEGSQP